MPKRRSRAPVLLNADLNLYLGRPKHRPRKIGLRQILPAKRRYDELREWHSQESSDPWTAARCRGIVATEFSIGVDTLRVWLTEANAYRMGTHRRVGVTKPKKKVSGAT